MNRIVFCHEFEEYQCCSFCHNDWKDGYDEPMEQNHSHVTTHGCCGFHHWYCIEGPGNLTKDVESHE